MCFCKLLELRNFISHTSHSYGFSFVCVRMCVAKCDGVVHILPQTPHSCCPLFLFAAFFVAVVISFRIISSCISTSPTTSSTSSSTTGGGIFKHNTFGSSFSSFKTVLAFSALFGCGFFLRPPIITFSIIFRRRVNKRVFMRETNNEGISNFFTIVCSRK